MRSDYEILGISHDADQNEIKKAYFRQIRKHTPEKDPEGFKEIRAAYERLKTEKREDDAPVFPPMKEGIQARFLDQIDKCLKTRDLQLGLDTAMEAVRLFPDTQIFLYRLSELQRKCGNTGKAVKTAQKLVDLDPDNRWYYRELGMACKGRGYHKKAFEAFYKAHELGCRDAEFMSAFIDTCLENDEDNYAAELMLGIVRSKKEWKPDELSFGNRLFDRLVILYCRYEERYSDIPDIYLDFMEANMKQMAKGREVYDLATLRILAMSSIDNKPVLNRCRKIIAEMIRTVPEREAVSDVERLEADLEVFIFESDDRVDENLQYLYSCLDDEYLEARNYAILDCRLCLIESCTDPQSQKDILMADYPKQYEALEPYLNELMKGSQAVAALKINLQKSYANYCQYCSGGRYFELYPDEKVKVLIATGEKPYTREHKKIGRNDPCPCGSGRKYKQCCMNKGK